MKNQYFGDQGDLLKYSLLEAIVRHTPNIDQLSCIWLLTAPSRRSDGNRHFTVRDTRSDLATFLSGCLGSGRRDVRELARYMATRPWKYWSFGDAPPDYFTRASRTIYFKSIPDAALRRSVVFFDPDNGLEPPQTVTPAHIKFAELHGVFERMDENSIAVVYQHLPRQKATWFWPSVAERLASVLDAPIGYVASGQVGFLIAPRDAVAINPLRDALLQLQNSWTGRLKIVFPG